MIKQITSSPLLRNVGIYAFLSTLNSSVPFLLLPVLTRFLAPDDYGVIALFEVLVGFLSVIIGVNAHGAIVRQYFRKSHFDFPKYVGNSLLILITSAFACASIFYLFSEFISKLTKYPSNWLWAAVLFSFTSFISIVVLSIFQAKEKPISYGLFQVSLTSFNLIFSLFFVVGLHLGWQGRVLGQVFASTMFAIVGLFLLYRNGIIRFKYDSSYVKHALGFGGPLVFDSLGHVAIAMTDRLLLANMVDLGVTGLYVVAVKIGALILLIQNAFNLAWVPFFYRKLNEKNVRIDLKIVQFTYIYSAVLLVVSVLLGFLAPGFMSIVLGKNFEGSSIFVMWIAVGYAFNGIYKMFVNYLFYAEKTNILPFVTVFLAILNVATSYFLILLNGPIGAAQGTMISLLISSLLMWFIASRLYKMPWFNYRVIFNVN